MNDDKKILSELRKMFNLIRRNTHHEFENIQNPDLTPMQLMALGFIGENSNRSIFQRDIESAFNIRRSTVSNVIGQLEEKGYIERQSVKDDARLKKIVLTTKSKKMEEALFERLGIIEEEMKKGVSKEKLTIFFDVIDSINKNMEEK